LPLNIAKDECIAGNTYTIFPRRFTLLFCHVEFDANDEPYVLPQLEVVLHAQEADLLNPNRYLAKDVGYEEAVDTHCGDSDVSIHVLHGEYQP
jgi:hypothetical protein